MQDAYDYQRGALSHGVSQDTVNPINFTYDVLDGISRGKVALKDTAYGVAHAMLRPFVRGRERVPEVEHSDVLRLQFISVEQYQRMARVNRLEPVEGHPFLSATTAPSSVYQHGTRVSMLRFEHSSAVRVPRSGVALLAFNDGDSQWGCRAFPYKVPTGYRVLKLAVTERSKWSDCLKYGRPINMLEVMLAGGDKSAALSVDDAVAATVCEPTANSLADVDESMMDLINADGDEDDEDSADGKRDLHRNMNSVVAKQLSAVIGAALSKSVGGAQVTGAVGGTTGSLPIHAIGDESKAACQQSWPGLAHFARTAAIICYREKNRAAIDARAKNILRRRLGSGSSAPGRDTPVKSPPAAGRSPLRAAPFELEAMLELAREYVGLSPASPLADAMFEVYQRVYGPDLRAAIGAMPTFDDVIDQQSGLPACFDRVPLDQLKEMLDAEIDDMREASEPRDKLDRYAAALMRDTQPLGQGGALFGPSGVADFIVSLAVPKLYELTAESLHTMLGMSRSASLSGYPVGGALADSHTTSDVRGLQMTVMASAYDAVQALRSINMSMCDQKAPVALRRAVLTTYVFNWRHAESMVARYETGSARSSMIPLRDSDRLAVYATATPTMQGIISARATLFPATHDELNKECFTAHGQADPRALISLKYTVAGVSNGGNTILALDSYSGVVVAVHTAGRVPVLESAPARNGVIVDMFAAVYKTLEMHESKRRSPLGLFEVIKGTAQARRVSELFGVQQPSKSQGEVSDSRANERHATLVRAVQSLGGSELVMLAGAGADVRSSLMMSLDPEDPSNRTLIVTMGLPDGSVSKLTAKFDPRFGRMGGEFRMQRRGDDEEPASPLLMQEVASLRLADGSSMGPFALVSYYCSLYTTAGTATRLAEEQARRLQSKTSAAGSGLDGAVEDDDTYHVINARSAASNELFAPGSAYHAVMEENPHYAGLAIAGSAGGRRGRRHLLAPSWTAWHTSPNRWPYYGYTRWY